MNKSLADRMPQSPHGTLNNMADDAAGTGRQLFHGPNAAMFDDSLPSSQRRSRRTERRTFVAHDGHGDVA